MIANGDDFDELRHRSAIEHMKSDGKLGRNHLKGIAGDAMSALHCGTGHNPRKILTRIRLLWLQTGWPLEALLRLDAFFQPAQAAA